MVAKKKDSTPIPQKWEDVPEIPKEEHPYHLPDGWKWVKLGEVTDIIMGQSPPGDGTTDDSSFVPLIGGASDMGILYPCVRKYTTKPTKLSKEQDIILCIRATLGKPIFSDGVYCLGRGVAAIRPILINGKFLRFYFINAERYFYEHAVGSTFLQISSDKLKKMPLPYPPFETQQRIVTRIESLFSKLDDALEKIQIAIDGYEARKQTILRRAFNGALTLDVNINESETYNYIMEIPIADQPYLLPDGWKWVRLGDVIHMQAGKNINANQIHSSQSDEFPYPCYGGNGIRGYVSVYNYDGHYPIIGRQGALCGNIHKANGKFYATEHAVTVSSKIHINISYVQKYLEFMNLNQYATATAQP